MSITKLIARNNEFVFDLEKIFKAVPANNSLICLEMSEKERKTYHTYIRIMAELGWPAYNDGDFDFHKHIVDLFKTGQHEKIETAIYDHYDKEYIEKLQDYIEEAPLVNNKRIPILKEAFTLYNLEYYYGSAALLTSQIAGIAKDIEQELLEHDICFDPYNDKLLESRYKVSKTSEKAGIIRILLEGSKYNDEEREYLFSIGYFRSKVFSNKLIGDDQLHHINRNMFFHGEQLTFGSKEQVLKLILCIDMLYNVADVLYTNLLE